MFQNTRGQTTCMTCTNTLNKWYGSTVCPIITDAASSNIGLIPTSTNSSTPGQLVMTGNGLYISFNCPSGLYSTTVQTPQQILIASSWAYQQWAGYSPSKVFDMVLGVDNMFHSLQGIGQFLGVNLGSTGNINNGVHFLLFDRMNGGSATARENTLNIYIGSVNYPNTAAYPIATQTNTLCYQTSALTQGYRNPLYVYCSGSGQYMYIVQTVNDNINLFELAVYSSPPVLSVPLVVIQ